MKSKTKVVCNHTVMKEVSSELGLSMEIVKDIISSQSYFTKQIMESNSFDSIRWPYLGIFKSKPKEVQILNHLKGLTPEQARDFKRRVRRGEYRLMREAQEREMNGNTEG